MHTLTLWHSETQLYEKIHRSEQKYKVALEILSYHNTTTEEELELLKDKQVELQPRVGEYVPKHFDGQKLFHLIM